MSTIIVSVKMEPQEEAAEVPDAGRCSPVAEPEFVDIKIEPLDELYMQEDSLKVEVSVEPCSKSEPRRSSGDERTPHDLLEIDYSAPSPGSGTEAANAEHACEQCGSVHATRTALALHLRRAHPRARPHACEQCGKTFRTASNLQQHRKIHSKQHECDLCGQRFAVRANLAKHRGRSRCGADKRLVCEICDKVFKRQVLLKSHLRKHTTERPFECEQCGEKFKHKSTLVRHAQLHSGDRPYACQECGKTFTHSGLMKPHMRKHTGEKPYQCAICLKLFAHKHNMQRHALRHNKIKHLNCEVCHKQFPKESRLKYHMRIHAADNRPFKCDLCPKSFSHKQNIMRHYRRKHPGATYDRPETDASVASLLWQSVLSQKQTPSDYILPTL